MAFGFGFNKQKVLGTAEKYVQQGKLQNAIAEYAKIVKADPKDLTVLNTIGDLYARLGDGDKAVDYFKQVGDTYASEGFTVKAIAVYKKIGKIKTSLEGTLKLAELYTQQGLFNDARAQYLQVAEEFLRNGELDQAVRIFQKTLEMDPENVAMKLRLGDVYVRLNRKNEAWQIFNQAAELLRSHGSLEAAEDVLKRMQELDPKNGSTMLLRGRNSLEAGDAAAAIQCFEKIPDLDQNAEGLRDLMQAYLKVSRLPEAGVVANKLCTVHNDVQALATYADALMETGAYADALRLYQQNSDRLLAANTGKVQEHLHSLIGHMRDDRAALQSILDLLVKSGDTSHSSEVIELLAHASVQHGELEKARDLYLQLATVEPENPLHTRNYQQVVAMIGAKETTQPITSEEGALMVDELEALAPFVDQHYSEEVLNKVRAALTDAELFVSYNMPEKALGPLLAALPVAPRDQRLNQRLASLHTRTGRFADAAMCSRTLQSVYSDAGHHDEASRYAELADKYESRAAQAAQVAQPAVVEQGATHPEEAHAGVEPASQHLPAWPAAAPPSAHAKEFAVAPHEEPAAEPFAAPEFAVAATPAEGDGAIDISDEWEGAVAEPVPQEAEPVVERAPVTGPVADTVEEIRFYLQNSMVDEARATLYKLETQTHDPAVLAAMRAEIAEHILRHEAAPAASEAEVIEIEDAPLSYEEVPEPVEEAQPEAALAELDLPDALPEPEPYEVAEPVMSAEPAAHEAKAPPPAHHIDSLQDFVSDLEAVLPEDFGPPMDPVVPPPAAPEHPVPVYEPEPAWEPEPAMASAPEVIESSDVPVYDEVPPPPAALPMAPGFAASGMAAAAAAPAPVAAAPTARAAAGADLNDIFDELKAELDDGSESAAEDPENHYNLGVAFREMGLVDEAIGELQKVCQAVDRGVTFPQTMQAYTWLAHCFLDKGVPEASVRWYEKALKLPTIDEEARTALHYELGSAYEAANNRRAALAHYMEAYGANIDYRDVAERIHALKS
jgi:tetratricopeptide (TPR) repeat protein